MTILLRAQAFLPRLLGVVPTGATLDLLLHEGMDVGMVRFAVSAENLIGVTKLSTSTMVTDGTVAVLEESMSAYDVALTFS